MKILRNYRIYEWLWYVIKLFYHSLKDKSLQWYFTILEKSIDSYEYLIHFVIDNFKYIVNETILYKDLCKIKQQNNEKLIDFIKL